MWVPFKHTRPHPTDAYGTIEFQGGAHPTKAQVCAHINKYSSYSLIFFCFIYLFICPEGFLFSYTKLKCIVQLNKLYILFDCRCVYIL